MNQDTKEVVVETLVKETNAVENFVEDTDAVDALVDIPVEASVKNTDAVKEKKEGKEKEEKEEGREEKANSFAPPHLQSVPDEIPTRSDTQKENVVIDVTSYPCNPSKVDGNHVICDCMMARLAFLENIVNHIPANVRMDMIRRMQGSISTLVGGLNV